MFHAFIGQNHRQAINIGHHWFRSLISRLSNPTQNDLPPPYSVAVHTQPPLKKDEEVVYDVRPGLNHAAYPHYIHQHPPNVVVPQTVQSGAGECSFNMSAYFRAGNTAWMCVQRGWKQLTWSLRVRLQPRAAKGEDAARIMPSATAAQEEPCSFWLCWLWPSGLEVGYTVLGHPDSWNVSSNQRPLFGI